MREYEIREIYKSYKGVTQFQDDKIKKYTNNLSEYLNNGGIHLLINDDKECESLTDDEMKEKYNSGECFNSLMFEDDVEYIECRDNGWENIYDCITYKTFCVHKEIEALIYFHKNEEEIMKILNDKYYLLGRDISQDDC